MPNEQGTTLKQLKAVIIGAGLMGTWHARYARKAGAAISAVVDQKHVAASHLAARFPGARALSLNDDWLDICEADVAHVCTPIDAHARFAEAALQAGCHVVVEKPLALGVEETRAIIDLAESASRRVIAVHQFPFQSGFRRLKRRLSSLGELRCVTYSSFTAGGQGRNKVGRQKLLLEILPHPVSLFRALGLREMDPSHWHVLRFTDDDLSLWAERGPTHWTIQINLAARPTRNELFLAGTEGTALVDLYHGYCFFDRGGAGRASKLARPFRLGSKLLVAAGTNVIGRTVRREPAFPGLSQLLKEFYVSIPSPGTTVIAPAEMLDAAALVEQVERYHHACQGSP